MPIVDLANNPIDPSAVSFLGYRSTEAPEFKHDIYSFIIKSIRDLDQENGELLLSWLAAAQSEFEDTYERIDSLRQIYDPALAPVSALQYVRSLVGLTDEVVGIIGKPSESDLRRLISVAVKAWKYKGSVKGLADTLKALTGKTVRVIDYFRFRTIVDEAELGWAELDVDPWLIDVPGFSPADEPDAVSVEGGGTFLRFTVDNILGSGEAVPHQIRMRHVDYLTDVEVAWSRWDGTNNVVDSVGLLGQTGSPDTSEYQYRVGVDPDEYVSDLRIVDDGSLDRTMVEGLVSLFRPSGERIYVRYLDFQDDFREEILGWTEVTGTATNQSSLGRVVLSDGAADSVIATDETGDGSWTTIRAGFHLMLSDASKWGEVRFYYTDENNFYAVRVDPTVPSVKLDKVTGGVRSTLDSSTLAAFYTDTFYMVHVQTDNVSGPGHQIRCQLDGNLMCEAVDSDHTAGKLAVAAETGQTLTLTLADMYQDPLESTRIGPT